MRLWRKAAGALKDHNGIWLARVSRRTEYRNPDLEAAIIKATSHDESQVDYKNAQRVFAWIRASPAHVKPLVCALSNRMLKTRSWVVALKGLMLLHGVLRCQIPALQKLGRLPFDLSTFSHAHSKPSKSWGYSAFVRAYFTFLDQKSTTLSLTTKTNRAQVLIMAEVLALNELQSLLDLILQVRPQSEAMMETGSTIILEAMDCVIIEIFDVYGKICSSISRILSRVCEASKVEASLALEALHHANKQSEELSRYFEFCKCLGVLNASEFPRVELIPEDDIKEFERVANGMDRKEYNDTRAIVFVRETKLPHKTTSTIVTEKWEVFEDDFKSSDGETHPSINDTRTLPDPFAGSLAIFDPHQVHPYKQEIPDLITF